MPFYYTIIPIIFTLFVLSDKTITTIRAKDMRDPDSVLFKKIYESLANIDEQERESIRDALKRESIKRMAKKLQDRFIGLKLWEICIVLSIINSDLPPGINWPKNKDSP